MLQVETINYNGYNQEDKEVIESLISLEMFTTNGYIGRAYGDKISISDRGMITLYDKSSIIAFIHSRPTDRLIFEKGPKVLSAKLIMDR